MTIKIYTVPKSENIDIKGLYRDDSMLSEQNMTEIKNAWWWTDQIFKNNEMINAEIRSSYLIYKRLTIEDKPEYCDNKQYDAIISLFNNFNFELYDYIIKCTW